MAEPLLDEEIFGDSDSDSCDGEDKTSESNTDPFTSTNISEKWADYLYDQAGTRLIGQQTGTPCPQMIVTPNPRIMLTSEESYIFEAKEKLQVDFALEQFQIQALLGMIMNKFLVILTLTCIQYIKFY